MSGLTQLVTRFRTGRREFTSIRCHRCDAHVTQWMSLLWQREKGLPNDEIKPVDTDELRTWCLPCAEIVKPVVHEGIINALLGSPDLQDSATGLRDVTGGEA
jgi:hypothetical protein